VNKAFITIIDLEAVSPNSMQLHGYRGVARGALVIEANRVLLLGVGEAPGGASASPPSPLGTADQSP
jgi:hypothetical protein